MLNRLESGCSLEKLDGVAHPPKIGVSLLLLQNERISDKFQEYIQIKSFSNNTLNCVQRGSPVDDRPSLVKKLLLVTSSWSIVAVGPG